MHVTFFISSGGNMELQHEKRPRQTDAVSTTVMRVRKRPCITYSSRGLMYWIDYVPYVFEEKTGSSVKATTLSYIHAIHSLSHTHG